VAVSLICKKSANHLQIIREENVTLEPLPRKMSHGKWKMEEDWVPISKHW